MYARFSWCRWQCGCHLQWPSMDLYVNVLGIGCFMLDFGMQWMLKRQAFKSAMSSSNTAMSTTCRNFLPDAHIKTDFFCRIIWHFFPSSKKRFLQFLLLFSSRIKWNKYCFMRRKESKWQNAETQYEKFGIQQTDIDGTRVNKKWPKKAFGIWRVECKIALIFACSYGSTHKRSQSECFA